MSRLQDIRDSVLPGVAASGRLGPGVRFVTFQFDPSVRGEAQFASTVYFLVGEFQTSQGTLRQPLVVKYNMTDELVRQCFKLDAQFQNEVITYEHVLPFLYEYGKINDMFPKFFLGSTESPDPENFFIVLEDLRDTGYKLTKEILDLDFEHCALAFKKLGTFHALSFTAKKLNSELFFGIVDNLVETRIFDEEGKDGLHYLKGPISRAARPLLEKGVMVKEINEFVNKIKNSTEYFRQLFEINEPMGVIGHGDFCRNNVLYKYDMDKPVDIKFFDLAHARYTSPMLDFAFFFLLNCSEESRKLHREDYLHMYHEALTSAVPEDVEVPTLDEFREEFRLKAVYGFMHCSFFKPAMMDPIPLNPVEAVRQPFPDRADKMLEKGGEKATEIISNMLYELIELGCAL